MNFRRNQVSIGIECCEQQIRAVYITKTKKFIQINTTAIIDIKKPVNQNQITALMKIRELLRYEGESTIYTINHNQMITKIVSVDAKLNDDEIVKYLSTQSSIIFGYPHHELFFDYHRIGFTKKIQHLQAVAAKKAHIHAIQHLFSQCKFRLTAIEVAMLSIGRVLSYLSHHSENRSCLGVMVFYCHQLLFGVFDNKKNSYSVTIDYTGGTKIDAMITSCIKNALQLFENSNPHLVLNSIVIMGKSKYTSIAQHYMDSKHHITFSLASLNAKKIHYSTFDECLFTSLGAAIWCKET